LADREAGLRLQDEQVKQFRDEVMRLLEQDFEQVENLDNYEVYHRKTSEGEDDLNHDSSK